MFRDKTTTPSKRSKGMQLPSTPPAINGMFFSFFLIIVFINMDTKFYDAHTSRKKALFIQRAQHELDHPCHVPLTG